MTMERAINVSVKDKIAAAAPDALYICGNSDYSIQFEFDAEWKGFPEKTARFIYSNQYQDVIFQDSICPIPAITGALAVSVGVFAGNLCTTTPAVIKAQRSILCPAGTPADPSEDVYNQLMAEMNRIYDAITTGGGAFSTDATLKLENGVLSVNTTDEVSQDNTLPITSAGVAVTVGNIEILLATI